MNESAESLAEFVVRRAGALQRFAYLVTGNLEDAKDAVQDTLAAVFPRWEQIVSRGDPERYLRRAIVNANISRWRRFGAEQPSIDPTSLDSVAPDPYQRSLDADAAARLFATLPFRQRAALVLRFYEDRSFAEIAEICECEESTARSLVHRALAALREHLKDTNENE